MSVMVIVPLLWPPALGVKVALMVQLAPAASEPPQVWLSPKSPPAAMLVIVSVAVPLFVSVTV